MKAIEVNNLSKKYLLPSEKRIQPQHPPKSIARQREENSPEAIESSRELWALRDVSFEVNEGEAIGLIGRNGAGKSTLLKILSRITEPSFGSARLRGRVASLLEVGTGFHPELTGRENIFLNGTILGMKKSEIDKNFDSIVSFAEVERFIDTPVKRYSSGMYMRLAFGVAAHLTPEILIVDEVLAVGDFDFQRRCLGKMHDVASSGRTVVFVSHNMGAIEDLCSRSILFKNGRLVSQGPTKEVVAEYLAPLALDSNAGIPDHCEREGTGSARITKVEFLSKEVDRPITELTFQRSFRIRIHYLASKIIRDPRVGFAFLSEKGERIFQTETTEIGFRIEAIEVGSGFIDCTVHSPNLLPGTYFLEAWIIEVAGVTFADHIFRICKVSIKVDSTSEQQLSYLTYPNRGSVFLECNWSQVLVTN